jgi:hypothetical protein
VADDLRLDHPHGRELGAGVHGQDLGWVGEATREMPTHLLRENGLAR